LNAVKQKRDSTLLKLIALLSTVRWKNVLFTIIAQYIAFLFAFNVRSEIWQSIREIKVHMIIASTGLLLAAGYIINNFYDIEKDLINRPSRTRFQNLVSRGFKLNLYFLLNVIGLGIAFLASWRIFIYFLVFSFLLWFYSHKLSKMVLVRELSASFLSVMAFFSLVLYFKMFTLPFFLYGMSLFFLLFAREMYKDVVGVKGDVVHGYNSIATTIGVVPTKRLFQVIIISSLFVDAAFLWLNSKPEFYWVLGVTALLKITLIPLIDINPKPMHRITQMAIVTYVLGILWL
jgi:4-hydroxybenzoate polyprenyltransferase